MSKKYSSNALIKLIESDGWYQVSKNGSHLKFKHLTKPGIVVIPHPRKDTPMGTVNNILKQAGLK
jgi:predicted RNA binding protein YcfA (HicA-like mRNA interferase family)